jgi:Fe-S-cluster containining protein
MSAAESAASRLCAQCGMCCNGVMFHTVRLQPGDSAKELAALGFKLKRKRKHDCILQPCRAYRDAQCSIYASRPERCRLFECRQLAGVASGEITEAGALERIRAARQQVGEIDGLLQRAGETNARRPLSKRCENVLAEPLDPLADPETRELREHLAMAMRELDARLDGDFRIPKTGAS